MPKGVETENDPNANIAKMRSITNGMIKAMGIKIHYQTIEHKRKLMRGKGKESKQTKSRWEWAVSARKST